MAECLLMERPASFSERDFSADEPLCSESPSISCNYSGSRPLAGGILPVSAPDKRMQRRRIGAAGLALALVASTALLGSAALAADPAPPGSELVVNGGFGAGTVGWRTNNPALEDLVPVPGGHRGQALELKTSRLGGVVLNDAENTVARSVRGTRYAVSAWVKAASTDINGQLRVRESQSTGVIVHASTFHADQAGWKRVTLDFSTQSDNAKLDLNVLGWDVPAKAGLLVDDVSMRELPARSGAATPARDGTAAPAPTAPDTSAPSVGDKPEPPARTHPIAPVVINPPARDCSASPIGIPSCGVLLGAAVGGNTDPAAFEQSIGGQLQIRRTYWSGVQVDYAVGTASTDLAAGRLPWMSFKLPHSWLEMAGGKGDAWATDLAQKLSKLKGPVWVAFHHEPEGDGDLTQWVAMQQRLAPIIHKNSSNVAFTMVVTGWDQFYSGNAEYSLDRLWPGDGLVDLLGIDPFNRYGTLKNGKSITKMANFAASYYPQMQAFAQKHHTAWGISETGLTDAAAQLDPTWLARSYSDMATFGGVAYTYFNTSLNSNGATWEITNELKRNQFKDLMKSATSIR